jgi:putative endonuclease
LPATWRRGSRSTGRKTAPKYCRKYNLTRLVYAEPHGTIDDAIAREKAMKEWHRERKIRLIETANPEWADLWKHMIGA